MNKELEIWRFAAEKLRRSESVMLLVVAESSGSSPGRQGFKMIVADNEMRGSIGGGVMEMRLVELAKGKSRLKIQNSQSEIIQMVHQKNAENASGMICSGKQTVVFFRLDLSHIRVIEKIIFALEHYERQILQISDSEITVENFRANDADFSFSRNSETAFLYREKLGSKNKLCIIGGGHCALALSELMAKMDFYIALFDDRANLNTLEKNSFADEKKTINSFENIGEYIESGANVYVVVMTLGYQFDEIVIRKLIEKNFKYFGVLGSKAKMKTLLKSLEKEGFDQQKLTQIRTPIGLPINSHTPEEIAVSIAAEIIQVKNKSVST